MRYLLLMILSACSVATAAPVEADCSAYPDWDLVCEDGRAFVLCDEGADAVLGVPLDLGPACRPEPTDVDGGWCCNDGRM